MITFEIQENLKLQVSTNSIISKMSLKCFEFLQLIFTG